MTNTLRLTLRACANVSFTYMLKFWHRTVGLFAAVFLTLLTLTGLLLMQTDELELDSRYVNSSSLLDWYGIRPPPPPVSFAIRDRWITQVGHRLYMDHKPLVSIDDTIIGVAQTGDEILVATTGSLILVTNDGEIAEKLGAAAGIPPDLQHLGTTVSGEVYVRGREGQFIFDPVGGSLRPAAAAVVHWVTPAAPPDGILGRISQDYRGNGLSLERVIIDLHTGRLFGTFGVALINLTSVLLLILITSGALLWWLRSRNN